MHPEPASVAEGVRVGLLDRGSRRRADVREEEVRRDPGGELAQVPVVPCRVDAAVEPWGVAVVVPADAEAIAVRRRCAQPGVQALVDQRAVAVEEQLLEPDRASPNMRANGTSSYLFPAARGGLDWMRDRRQGPLAVAASGREARSGSAVARLLGRRRVNTRDRSASSATASIAFFKASSWASA